METYEPERFESAYSERELFRDSPEILFDYVLLGLRIGKILEGYVDAYYGPQYLWEQVENENIPDPNTLLLEAKRLYREIQDFGVTAEMSSQRQAWIIAQVFGMVTSLEKCTGSEITYEQEVLRCYNVKPHCVDESEFIEAHKLLDLALPGSGNSTNLHPEDLYFRMEAWRKQQIIPNGKLSILIDHVAQDFRNRTNVLFVLPEGEEVEFNLVQNEPWSGFNYYLGNYKSSVAINTDLPMYTYALPHLIAHEAYPGHHSEHSRKEAGLVRKARRLEETLFMVGTPQCVIAEGLADVGLEVLLGDIRHEIITDIFQDFEIPYDADQMREIEHATQALQRVRGNVAWYIHQEHMDHERAITYLMQWGLMDRNRAEKSLSFLLSPTWRAYISCYIEGWTLCHNFIAEDPIPRFTRLLNEQFLPQDLF